MTPQDLPMTVLMFSCLVYFVSGEFLDLSMEAKSCPKLYFLVHHHPDPELTIRGQPIFGIPASLDFSTTSLRIEVRDLGVPGVGGKGGKR